MSNASATNGVPSDPWHAGTCGVRLATSNSAESKMSKRFYLATRKDRAEQAAALLEALKAQGWERTYAWTSQDDTTPNDTQTSP